MGSPVESRAKDLRVEGEKCLEVASGGSPQVLGSFLVCLHLRRWFFNLTLFQETDEKVKAFPPPLEGEGLPMKRANPFHVPRISTKQQAPRCYTHRLPSFSQQPLGFRGHLAEEAGKAETRVSDPVDHIHLYLCLPSAILPRPEFYLIFSMRFPIFVTSINSQVDIILKY